MKVVNIRRGDNPPISVAVDDRSLKELAGILEASSTVVSFCVVGHLSQREFGCGGYTKWVAENWPLENER